jgi:hypothetical protein
MIIITTRLVVVKVCPHIGQAFALFEILAPQAHVFILASCARLARCSASLAATASFVCLMPSTYHIELPAINPKAPRSPLPSPLPATIR